MIIHALLGVLIANNVHSKILVLILGILSHYAFDMIPHWDGGFDRDYFKKTGRAKMEKLNIFVHVIDVILIVMLFFSLEDIPVKGLIFGAIAALIPDLLKVGYLTRLKNNKKYMGQLHFHSRIQKDINWKLGLLIQIVIALIIIYLIPFSIL